MRRRSPLKTFKNWAIYRALTAADHFGRGLSLEKARALGRSVGALAYRSVPRERRRALSNLAAALPELSPAEHDRITREMFRHLGVSLLEICWLPNLNAANLEAHTTFEGLEHFRSAHEQRRGVVLFTGHCGNWEWMAAAIGILGFDMNVVAREIYDPRLNEFVVRSRARHNIKTIGRGSAAAAREILNTLRSGAILGVLIDQKIKAENAPISFFGREAPTPIGPAKLAIRAGAIAIAGFIERRGAMQHIRFEPWIATSRDDDPVELTAQMTRSIEQQIRRVPSQWVWMHKRW